MLAADTGWAQILGALELGFASRELAESCHMSARSEGAMTLEIPKCSEYLFTDQQRKVLVEALKASLGASLNVEFTVVDKPLDTIAESKSDDSRLKMDAAHDSIHNDPNVQAAVDMFNATVEEDSIRPVNGQDR
jgi:DNA polymerase-3 subunit gamma/tau